VDRLQRGLVGMRVDSPSEAALAAAVEATLRANGLTEARVRLSVSAGRMATPDLATAGPPSVVVTADAMGGEAVAAVRLRVSSIRVDEGRPLGFAKTAQYLVYLLARAEARAAGVDDALLLNGRGDVCEAATANVFAVMGGRLVTPSTESGPVVGVARSVVLELAVGRGLAVEERVLELAELKAADELFLTNSIVGAQPVVQVDDEGGQRLWRSSEGSGEVTEVLREAYALAVKRECEEG